MYTYKGVDHVTLVTKRLPDMIKFYKLLGLSVEWEGKSKAGYSVATLGCGNAVIDLYEATPANPARPGPNLTEEHICLVAQGTSVYDVIATLKRVGLEPTQAEVTSGAEGKSLSTFVRDPDGNRIEIKVY